MAFAVLYLPLVTEFGGSRGEVATVHSAVLLLGGFGSPIIGWAFDRLGPRRLFTLRWGASKGPPSPPYARQRPGKSRGAPR